MTRDARRHSSKGIVRRTVGLPYLLPALLLAAGCIGIDGPEETISADITVINGAADDIRVRVDGDALGGTTAPGELSTRIILTAGASTVRIEPSSGSSLSGGETVSLPADGTGSGHGRAWVLATSGVDGTVGAELIDDRDPEDLTDAGRVRVIQASASNRELDVWFSNSESPTLSRIQSPFDYAETSAFLVASGQVNWRIVVTPRMVPAPGEDPEANALASLDFVTGNGSTSTFIILDDPVNTVQIFRLP